jgi:hypothetical protein
MERSHIVADFDPFNGKQTTCMACGAAQDMKNGIARGACAVCYVGYLAGWHISSKREVCRYKGCGQKAVAEVGKWQSASLTLFGVAPILYALPDRRRKALATRASRVPMA